MNEAKSDGNLHAKVGPARAGSHEPGCEGGDGDKKNSESCNRIQIGQDEHLCAHPNKEATHQGSTDTQHLLLSRRTDGRKRGEETGRDRCADSWPIHPVINDVAQAGRQTPFHGKLDVLNVGERITNEKGWRWIAT